MAAAYDVLTEKSAGDAPPGARPTPKQWPGLFTGAGQFEYQDFDAWTPEEQKQWEAGTLRAKWGVVQVSIRLPIQSSLQFIAILYGYLPLVIPIWWGIWTIGTWSKCGSPRFYPTYGLCIAGVFALINETITKKLCRKYFSPDITSRPPEAVCKHPGMPSGHVMNAYTLMVWTLAEVAMDWTIHIDYLLILVIIMGPVPWARVYNKDHTVAQVQVSMVVATIMGLIATAIRFAKFPHHRGNWPWDWEGYHVHQLGMASPGQTAHHLGAAAPRGWDPSHCGLF